MVPEDDEYYGDDEPRVPEQEMQILFESDNSPGIKWGADGRDH